MTIAAQKPRITKLAEIDGLSIKNAALMPHPSILERWYQAGLVALDLDRDVFVLTEAGREEVWDQQSREARDEFRKVRTVMPERPEGYYHSPLTTP